ncbi:hypothetical protein PAT01_37780 [Pseudoalteromonas atlantica]|uniref:GIY-YIG domain-containing protein n=1 Tax=Pseudoalteromonas atlantica TaxID=288 RepID=A0ABQ0UJ34_PSEAF|nr:MULTISPECIES: GIY-YIG nuclease family protein [unclassified Pseudoalteromonas]TMO03299.1 excinuclease ABC subunit C [Pseudoalteromonas sp. S327]TMO18792.1 excinuclease ABC subunit C [Pseudoalteromonas sp. S326]GEK78474.1 hypothetical protein PAT01_37780 [Pseudoalteromonas atlantica]
MDIKAVRKEMLSELTDQVGVYALCDLDKSPIYIGQSTDGIRARVNRHLTSARSDVIANRQLDIWEIYEVWAWPVGEKLPKGTPKAEKDRQKHKITSLENYLISYYNSISPLVNGKLPVSTEITPEVPVKQTVPIMHEEERLQRLEPSRRLPRQMEHLTNLFSHILEVKNNPEQRRMLRVHFNRTDKYYKGFMADSGEDEV